MEAKRPEMANIMGKLKSSYEHYKAVADDEIK